MRYLWILTAFAIACSSTASSPPVARGPTQTQPDPVVVQPPAPPAPPPAPTPPGLRLGTTVKPTHYALDLTIVPTEQSFHGKVVIALDVTEPTSVLWLHGLDFTIDAATITAGGGEHTAKTVP